MAFDFGREWPFFPDDEKLRIYEPRANVALLIGHTAMDVGGATKVDPPLAAILERLPAALIAETGAGGSGPRVPIAAIGTIATLRDGVERVVQNLLTNPHITVLVLCGDDSPVFYPLEGIRCLYTLGVDDGRHVIPADTASRAAKVFARDALATLSHEEIACFRRRELAIVDVRGALDPAEFFADVVHRLPELVRPVATPSWQVLEEIDPYRWRPRTIQVPAAELVREDAVVVAPAQDSILVEVPAGADIAQIVSPGKADGRAQRAMHEVLRRGFVRPGPERRSRLAALTLAAEQAVLAGEFTLDATRLRDSGLPDWGNVSLIPHVGPASGAVIARASPLRLDPTSFFKIRVAYEQGTLAADYHEAGGRHVETLVARRGEDLLAAIVAGTYIGGDEDSGDQHLVYLAVQIARADFALRTGLRFEEGQGLSTEARKNVDHHLNVGAVIAGGSLEETWVRGLTNLRDEGLLTTTQKGRVAEGWCTFFGVADMAAMTIPEAYPANDEHIAHYAAELLAPAPEVRARGDYTYGDRTCHYFFDQIAETGRRLAADPTHVYVNQRWAPEVDLSSAAHHRPCLVFDLWFRWAGRLHTLQIARSHDVYGGLPQNALGIARGWGQALAASTGLPLGDLWFCSISNNFRVGDDAENVRRAIQGGVHGEPRAPTLPAPRVLTIAHEEIIASAPTSPRERSAGPITAIHLAQVEARTPPPLDDILAATPTLADRLRRYRGTLDQVATVVARLRTEASRDTRDRSNSVLLSPRHPVADRERESTPLVCLQLRRQLAHLHSVAVLIGPDAPTLIPTLLSLHRHIAQATTIPPGSATFIHIADPPE